MQRAVLQQGFAQFLNEQRVPLRPLCDELQHTGRHLGTLKHALDHHLHLYLRQLVQRDPRVVGLVPKRRGIPRPVRQQHQHRSSRNALQQQTDNFRGLRVTPIQACNEQDKSLVLTDADEEGA